ncbi:hypothetical protein V2G26_019858 [Clonostachys chloroleuca]
MAPAASAPHTLENGIPYSVKLTIDHDWIKPFNDNGVRLIMAKVFKDAAGNETFNVVASAQDVTGDMTARWEDNYQICGSTDTFKSGQVISGISGLLDIGFQQTYVLNDWSNYFIQNDTGVPKTSFGFKNGVIASAVVQLKIDGQFSPIYMSPYKFPRARLRSGPCPRLCSGSRRIWSRRP